MQTNKYFNPQLEPGHWLVQTDITRDQGYFDILGAAKCESDNLCTAVLTKAQFYGNVCLIPLHKNLYVWML